LTCDFWAELAKNSLRIRKLTWGGAANSRSKATATAKRKKQISPLRRQNASPSVEMTMLWRKGFGRDDEF
jgi:hypothetical protein